MKASLFIAAIATGIAVQAQDTPATPKQPIPKGKGVPANFGKTPVPLGPAPKGCNKFEIIVARGTSEPGPFGIFAGDPLVSRVTKALPDSRGYAVQYPADATPESSDTGAKDIVNRLKTQIAACPEQKFALAGYSQGARSMRKAAKLGDFDAKWADKIVGLVMYGDPGQKTPGLPFPEALQAKLLERCGTGDPVCDTKTQGDFFAHLVYNKAGSKWQDEAAEFLVAGFQGKPLPKFNSEPHD